MIGKSLVIKGEITGSESVQIDGTVEGSIMLPDDRVTVGPSGRVSADVMAQDIVVMPFWTPSFCRTVIRAAEAVGAFEPSEDDPVPAVA